MHVTKNPKLCPIVPRWKSAPETGPLVTHGQYGVKIRKGSTLSRAAQLKRLMGAFLLSLMVIAAGACGGGEEKKKEEENQDQKKEEKKEEVKNKKK